MEPAESSSSSKFPSPPQEHHYIDNNIQDEELTPAFDVEDLICTEQFDQIMENEVQEVVISDASSTNSTMDERKGLSFGDEAVSSATKVHRVKCISCDEAEGEVVQDMKMNEKEEKEQGHNESKDDYGNQESEQRESGDQESDQNDGEEDRNQEDSNEEEEDEDKKEDEDDDEGENRNQENNEEEEEEDEEIEDETEEEAEEGEKEESQPVVEGKQQEPDDEKGRSTRKRLFSELYESQTRTEEEGQEKMAEDTEGEKHNDQQEHTENNAEREDHDNNQSSEEQADNGNQESEQNEGNEDEVQEEEEVEDEEEEKRKAIAKGKRPQICKLAFVVRKYSNLQRGETSYKAEEEAIDNRQKEEVNQDSHEDEQDLVILKAISHFYYSNGYAPSPSSIELHKHIKNSIPSLTIRGEELTTKIGTLEDQFRTVKDLDGDNPDLPRPIDREIFDLSMSIWGHSEDDLVHNQGVPALNIDYQEHFLRHFLRNYLP